MTRNHVPCLYCGESFEFLTGGHLQRGDHFGDGDGFNRYKAWLVDEHDIDPDHEVFRTPGALTRPTDFTQYEALFQ